MSNKIRELFDKVEAGMATPSVAVISKDVSLIELAEMVVRGEIVLSPPQMRMLIELLPYTAPKLMAVGHGTLNDMTFAAKLERAVARSDKVRVASGPKLLEDLRFKSGAD